MSDYIPKVGDKVEYKCPQLNDSYENGLVVAIDGGLYVIRCSESDENSPAYNGYPLSCIRPIKSARDKAIDEMDEVTFGSTCPNARLYDAGYRKVMPISARDLANIWRINSPEGCYNSLLDNGHIVSE